MKNFMRGASPHGTAVAEAVIDIAPDATLYIANPHSRGDLQETATWMAGQGVTVINYSVGWNFDGPGDGTSPFSDSPLNTVDQAVAQGITWVNSAGNSAEDTWFGGFSDNDGDDVISFNNSTAEINSIVLAECRSYTFQLRWEDSWGGAGTDLDIYLWDTSTGDILDIPAGWGYVGSTYEQSGASNHDPFEYFYLRSPINSRDVGVIIVHESGPVPDWVHLELRSGPGGLEYSTSAGSIGNPAESANPGLLAVGAAPFYNTNTIEPFSSQGPTPDGRTKPDIVGVDCAAAVAYERFIRSGDGQVCWFPGTSQASPHVAGLATLVKQQNPGLTPQQVASYLKNNARDQGLVGPDNVWGSGLAQMPALTASESCLGTLTVDGVTSGQWAAGCQSGVTDRGYARYYSFTLEEDSEVTIDLSSDVDTYLYLRSGDVLAGTFVAENDDHEGSQRVSQISETLSAGSYTIEATTYNAGEAGSFTLTLSGLGGGTTTEPTDPDPGATDSCGATISGDGATPGTWATGCESQVTGRGYARYYGFSLEQESEVTIDLESSADTYLYLRSGDARSGTVLHYNDDVESGNTDSRISQTLAAGSYTIEATTYNAGEAGSFTLTLSGLGGGTTTEPTDPDPGATDSCGATISGDGATPGTWATGCESQVTGRGYARYYGFSLEQESEVTIDLESSADTYLYLRSGDARSGTVLHYNDDVESGNTDSRISQTLAAGSYTIEATTYNAGEAGSFTLTLSGLGGGTTTEPTDPDPGATDSCGATISGDGATPGTWATGCESQVTGRGYARYYGFSLEQESEVTIDLESSADTYLYLRSGDARSGTVLHYNDDVESGNTDSRISETLAAGSYTIEATTYNAGEAGSFTLTLSGLGGGTTTEPTDPDPGATDSCGATISGDGATPGTWATGCESQVTGRGYARYYGFSLEQESEVTIDLESSADTYLYLRSGDARSGTVLHYNDDVESGNTDSRISQTLAAGSYTIEATTYNAGDGGQLHPDPVGTGRRHHDGTHRPGPGGDGQLRRHHQR